MGTLNAEAGRVDVMVGDGGEGGLRRGERSEVMMAKKRNDGFFAGKLGGSEMW